MVRDSDQWLGLMRKTRPKSTVKQKNHPLVARLRGRIVPWAFGVKDEVFEGLVGTTAERFREFISAKFTNGMSWETHGYWHLDHIRPVKLFNHDVAEEVKACWHFTNFQPLWGRENSKKGAKLNYGKDINRTNHGVEKEEPGEVQAVPAGSHAQEEGLENILNRMLEETVD